MIDVARAANEAVFQLQFNSRDAIRYIQRNAGVDQKTAETVFKNTITFHKQNRVSS
jgi:hypothetical protein